MRALGGGGQICHILGDKFAIFGGQICHILGDKFAIFRFFLHLQTIDCQFVISRNFFHRKELLEVI